MRELKFRVWWKDNSLGHTIYTEGDFFDDTWTSAEYIAIEQYTGLKDKNGKEIYEGDIVKRTKMHGILRNVEEIEIFRIRWGVRKAGFFAYNKKRAKHGMSAKRLFAEDTYEVIGNIHESPELLEHKG